MVENATDSIKTENSILFNGYSKAVDLLIDICKVRWLKTNEIFFLLTNIHIFINSGICISKNSPKTPPLSKKSHRWRIFYL